MEINRKNLDNTWDEVLAERKEQWLKENGYDWKDVMEDDEGEYVLNVMEMDEGENGDYSTKKVYLPDFTETND